MRKGTHFRCGEVLHFFLVELASDINQIHVELNFFGEKHGKNSRDQHFSVISKFIELETHKKRLNDSKDIIECINKRQNASNLIRKHNSNYILISLIF